MSRSTAYQIAIAVIAVLLFLPTSTIHLFDWDEINFAEAAREMIVSGDYLSVQINFQGFAEKPPLYIWMQVLSMKAFGINEFAARFPNIICGVITLLFLFNIGKKIYSIEFGLIWVLAYLGSLLPQVYFMSGIIDPFYNLFIFIALYCTYQFWAHNSGKHLIYAAIWAGLAVLTKGPVAVLLLGVIIVIHSIYVGGNGVLRRVFTDKNGWLAILVFLLVCSIFYLTEFIRHGSDFFTDFIDYHLRLLGSSEAGHGQPFYYHFIVLLVGCLPTSILMLGGFRSTVKDEIQQSDFTKLMAIMFFVVLVIFSIVSTKIIHYSSLCYFPLTFLAARYIYNVAYRKMEQGPKIGMAMLLMSGLFALLLILLPTVMRNVDALIPYIHDPFAVGNLNADVHWPWYVSVGGLIYLISLVFFVHLSSRQQMARAYTILLAGTAIGINISFKSIVPKVEQITQNAAIEFYQGIPDEDCYLEVLDFKSYAHYFYGQKIRYKSPMKSKDDLLNGKLSKPAYFAVKNVNAKKFRKHSNLTELYEKNGFVFFKRIRK